MKVIYSFLVFLLLMGCNSNAKKEPSAVIADQTAPKDELALVPKNWIAKRVANSRTKLMQSEAGKVVWKAMQAHGGLEKWYANGPVSFRFNYQPLDGGAQRDTYQAIDTWRSRARHFHPADSSAQFGWNGKQAWYTSKDSLTFPYNTRFWALTPYFFAAQPFVLDGQGVNLELLKSKPYNDREQDVIKVTFDANTGDAPDDYYVLYFDKESHILSVIRYIVSYPGYFEKGKHLPEKFMTVEGTQKIDGIVFSKGYKTHWLSKQETQGEHITTINVTNVAFQANLAGSFFEVPETGIYLMTELK